MSVSLGTGPPYAATIILTSPKQLRFQQLFDQAYTIRESYVPKPPLLTDIKNDSFYLPEQFHEGLLYKFIAMVASDMGDLQLSEVWELKYQRWLTRAKNMANANHLNIDGVSFSHFA